MKANKRNDEERRQWVMNDEGLYLWWQRSRLPLAKFLKDNRIELDQCIDRALAVEPRG